MNQTSKLQNTPEHKPRPMIDLLVSIIIPSVILMKFSGDDALGATNGLILALSFPLGWGIFERIKYKKTNFISILGFVSILLTGGIGLFELDTQWLAIKEAAIPGIIGIAVLISTYTRYPLIKTLIYNPAIMNVNKIKQRLEERNNLIGFEKRLLRTTYLLSGTFFFSATMNYFLASWIVTSPTGTTEFNEELGRLTLMSYPVIAIPSMLMMMIILYYLWRTIRDMTGFTIEEIMVSQDSLNSKEQE